MTRIAIDPVTRIEGHLRIEVEVQDGIVTDAWSSGTMFRGIELILKDRDPRDAWVFAQRICGVCTTVHALTSVRAVENALNITIPENARLLRQLISGAQLVQDHVIHFYHLHALDWVDVTLALKADPGATSTLAQSISDYPKSSKAYFKGVQDKLKAFVDSGQLGLFANGYWGHPAYKLPPEANLMAVAHYLEALDWQRDYIRIHAILGGKNPHLQSYLVGGMATAINPNSPGALNADGLSLLANLLKKGQDFVSQVYVPDVLAVAPFYKEWAKLGTGLGNYMAYGDYPSDNQNNPDTYFFPRGLILNKDLSNVQPIDHNQIAEHVAHSWYSYQGGDEKPLHPWSGETKPNYTGPKPPFEMITTDKYSWLKAPRYQDNAVEVGPLARMLVAYAKDKAGARPVIDSVLKQLGVDASALFSTLGRVAARAIEASLMTQQLPTWLNQLEENIGRGNLDIHNNTYWKPESWPKEAQGYGFHEAPRGALGHWVQIKDGVIKNYQAVVPSTWNAGPRDAKGQRGAYEQALIGTPVVNPEQPVEILRTIHSFDPCLACAVHVVDPKGREYSNVRVV
ncbi:MAG: nickel-dependent hydrogenase large subunit [Chloroflexi bacterium]|uniref:Nickel-dependent hydrogenase large subunit n=1 Tax=Candidatus Chlorohelix allophototropha TaxID=3003348 RepID=A0A8T7MAA6_9CHLR|nr:nickel-dependent hydrogenase large subunit [Chloroflexota bacterium]WJW68993.1 nickel-dependent hydrogenase large subunit [Chloroflexota bacterium L227-S17]